mgnify:CR=1 FL=1
MFKITLGKGFQVTFANGYTVSVQWGYKNYCENQWNDFSQELLGKEGCINAEVAAWGPGKHGEKGPYMQLQPTDKVVGWQTPDEVLAIMVRIAALPSPEREKPQFEHDCSHCTFLGRFDDGRPCDLYWCQGLIETTVIARYSDEGSDYTSGMIFADRNLNPALVEAKRRAVALGLPCPPDEE